MADVRAHQFLGMTLISASPAMAELLARVQRIAATSSAVLIVGESGTGKELVARAVHQYSSRSNKAWIDVSCGALPDQLLESELFGYERGAFSGAEQAKPGMFELAQGGTLFLDEIGELEPRMQVKLLRVLDGAPYFRLGGVRKVAADARVVAATNRDLEESVADGRFRQDLYYRLSQFVLRVPPLRERPEDIEPLARHWSHQADPAAEFSDEALQAMIEYPWPGNVRELRNVVSRAAVLRTTARIEVSDLGLPRNSHLPASSTGEIDTLERRAIFDALDTFGGHREKTAAKLGISSRTLARKLKAYEAESRTALAA